MAHAYVLVTADVGRATDLTAALRGIDRVTEAHVVAGDWDIVVEMEAPTVYDALDTAADAIQGLDGVTGTKTYVSLEG